VEFDCTRVIGLFYSDRFFFKNVVKFVVDAQNEAKYAIIGLILLND